MSKERILLLCDIPPCKNYTGGIMNSQLLEFLFDEGIDVGCICVMDYDLQPVCDDKLIRKLNIKYYKKSSEIFEYDNEYKRYYKNIRKIINGVTRYVRKNNITKIWCPLQGEVLTLVLNEVHKRTGVKYIVQIWDPIEWWIRDHKFSEERKNSTLEVHTELLKNASCCVTTSNAMSKYFKDKFGIDCISVMPPLKRKAFDVKKDDSKFIIAMSGQVYAKDELDSFLSALDMFDWTLNGKDVYFEHFGTWSDSYIDFSKHTHRERIILRGFINQNDLLPELSKTDLLYCPYFFSDDENLKMVSSLSFPSKVVTYLALEVPTLIHGPNYSSPYIFLKENKCAYLLDTNDPKKIKDELSKTDFNNKDIIKNAKKCFDSNFDYDVVKDNFFKALDIQYDKTEKLNILEVNNIDLLGRRFNGYDLLDVINNETVHSAKQIVTNKSSSHPNVLEFYKNQASYFRGELLIKAEKSELSVHSQVSLTSNILKNTDVFKKSDLVHYHLIHNTKLSLPQMVELVREKPTVLTFHDPWNFTGRCVYPQECEKWKDGCFNCDCLDNLFDFTVDNCHSLWEQKKKIYEKLDIDIIVSTPFMKKMIEESPLTKHFKNIHILPFGVDLSRFNPDMDKSESRKKYDISDDEIVLFFRSQMAMKGTEFIIEALKMLKTDKKVTLLTCSCVGLLGELEDKYRVIDLGNIGDEEMVTAFNACDVFLMPSRGESFGLMAIEAMASSRPIVIFDNSALPYVTFAPECGVLVENKNSEKLMEAIKNLIDNPKEREKRGKLGRKLAEEHYDLNLYNKKLIEIYEKAYERQKYKVIKEDFSTDIDWTKEDVQILIPKLEKIYQDTFIDNDYPRSISIHKNEFIKVDKNKKIDYSDDDVIGLIKLFNDELYDKLLRCEEFHDLSSRKKLKYYFRYDRFGFYDRILEKIHNRYLHKIFEIFFSFLRKIDRIFYHDKFKPLVEENERLKFQIDNTKEIIKQLKDK